jgi:hypothetical protein
VQRKRNHPSLIPLKSTGICPNHQKLPTCIQVRPRYSGRGMPGKLNAIWSLSCIPEGSVWTWDGSKSAPEFGRTTVAVLRAELGDVTRFQRADQAVAYAGLDIRVKESGKWKGQAKLSKRGSGRLRRLLYLTAVRCIRRKDSAFGQYYHHLIARGMRKMEALMAVMRKMLIVA